MLDACLVIGSSGNASQRIGDTDTVAVTPSHVDYTVLEPTDVMVVNLEGEVVDGDRNPSSETPMHLAVYKAREDVGAIIHTHSIYASALAILGVPLPPVIDEFVMYLGGQVEVAKYGMPGGESLAKNAVEALGPRNAVLLANHGALCCAGTLRKAYHNALLLERVAQIYLLALSTNKGTPSQIPEEALSTQQGSFEMFKRLKRSR
jgi:L-fuculose-phosphate aldolase